VVTNMRRLQVLITEALVKAVDEWRRREDDLPSRSEAIRRLLEKALREEGVEVPKC